MAYRGAGISFDLLDDLYRILLLDLSCLKVDNSKIKRPLEELLLASSLNRSDTVMSFVE